MSIPVYAINKSIMVSESVLVPNAQFFLGFSAAKQPITPTETYAEVDAINGNADLYRIGILFGRASTYKAFIYLADTFSYCVPKEILDLIKGVYK